MSAAAKSALPWIGAALAFLGFAGGVVGVYAGNVKTDAEQDVKIVKLESQQKEILDLLRGVREDVAFMRGNRKK